MEEFKIRNAMKALVHRVDLGQLNAVYAGLAIGFINSNDVELTKLTATGNKKEITNAVISAYYDLNECATLDRHKFIDIAEKCIMVKFNTFKLPKFYITNEQSTFKDLLKTPEYLGGIEKDIDDNMKLFKSGLGVSLAYYESKEVVNNAEDVPDEETTTDSE